MFSAIFNHPTCLPENILQVAYSKLDMKKQTLPANESPSSLIP
jgi:hypothetical protein